MKNIFQENMRRFATKNLAEQDGDDNNNGYPDATERSSNSMHLMAAEDFLKKEHPHIHSWDETIDYNDMLYVVRDYAKYVATLAAQEFMDTDIPQGAIDEFLSRFNIS